LQLNGIFPSLFVVVFNSIFKVWVQVSTAVIKLTSHICKRDGGEKGRKHFIKNLLQIFDIKTFSNGLIIIGFQELRHPLLKLRNEMQTNLLRQKNYYAQ
jgi:hypothetical protein